MTKLYQITDELIPETDGETHKVARTFGGNYIGNPAMAKLLCDERGIEPDLITRDSNICSIGFSKKYGKWYGWSHRAIFGFKIGSKVVKGDCGYTADNPEEMIEDRANFFADISKESADLHRAECQILPDRSGIRILHAPLKIPVVESTAELVEFLDDEADLPEEVIDVFSGDNSVSERKCGRGEWTALTMSDARQMAIDFAESVS